MFKLKYYYTDSLPYKFSLELSQDSSNLIIKGHSIINYEDAEDVKAIFVNYFNSLINSLIMGLSVLHYQNWRFVKYDA